MQRWKGLNWNLTMTMPFFKDKYCPNCFFIYCIVYTVEKELDIVFTWTHCGEVGRIAHYGPRNEPGTVDLEAGTLLVFTCWLQGVEMSPRYLVSVVFSQEPYAGSVFRIRIQDKAEIKKHCFQGINSLKTVYRAPQSGSVKQNMFFAWLQAAGRWTSTSGCSRSVPTSAGSP